MRITGLDIPAYYRLHFRAGMADVSQSSPQPLPLPSVEVAPDELAAVRPPGGSHELREAVAARYRNVSPDDVLVCSGASEALVALALTLGTRGPVVAFPGGYPSFMSAARVVGARTRTTYAGGRPVCAVATNPDVPAGARLNVGAFIDEALSYDAVPIADEVYRDLVLDGGDVPAAAADLHPGAVSIGDLSKPLGYGGLRVGWLATRNRPVLDAVESWLELMTGGPSVHSNAAALQAFERYDEQVKTHIAHARVAADASYELLRAEGWSFEPAQLGLTVAASPPKSLPDGAVERTLEAGYFVMPSAVVTGLTADESFRFSVLAQPEDLSAALQLLTSTRS
jgi:aspartate/methionine/tyrosine aminotransferase